MAFDYKMFASELGLKDEDKTSLFGLFEKNPEVVGKLESLLDSQVQARLTPLQTELATKQRDLDAQFDTLASIRGGDEQAIAASEKRIEALSAQTAILTERLRKVATDAGLNAEDVLQDMAGDVRPPERKPVDTPLDLNKLVSEVNQRAWVGMKNTALLEDLAAEHQTLFGKPMSRVQFLDTFQETVKRTGNTNLGLRDVFDQTFKIAEKREEIREADVQRRIKDAVTARETALNDEFALRQGQPGMPPAHPAERSPVLATIKQGDGETARVGGLPAAVVASIADYKNRMSTRKTA